MAKKQKKKSQLLRNNNLFLERMREGFSHNEINPKYLNLKEIKMSTDSIDPQKEPNLLKVTEIAKILNISRAYAYRLMQQGHIRTVKIGTACRVRPEDLHKYIQDNLTSGVSQ